MNKDEKKRGPFTTSIDTESIYNFLKAQAEDEISYKAPISYDEISAQIGRDVRASARGNLNTARKRLLAEHGIVFRTVHNVGLLRMKNEEIAAEGTSHIQRVHRASRRAMKQLACVDLAELDGDKKQTYLLHTSALGAIHQVTDRRRLESAKNKRTLEAKLPTAKMLDLFKDG